MSKVHTGSTTASKEVAMSKHTPGPWNSDVIFRKMRVEGHILYKGENGPSFAIIENRSVLGRPLEDEEANANARLISAAPEILEALEQSQREIEQLLQKAYGEGICFEDCQTWVNNHKALTKARGETALAA